MQESFSFQLEPLRSLLADFYAVTRRQIGLFDAAGNVVLRYPESMPLFCHIIMSSPKGREKCAECDRKGCQLALRQEGLVSYPCHAGLKEVCAPIRLEGQTVGYLMFGHILSEETREKSWKRVIQNASSFFDDPETLRAAFEQLEDEPMDYIRSLSNILESCVCYIQLRHLFQSEGISRWARISGYVDAHLKERIPLSEIASILNMSESTLNRECLENTGNTLSRYIKGTRLKTACRLLVETELPIARVADECGFDNYNYFSRWFREETGSTPSGYRKRNNHSGATGSYAKNPNIESKNIEI